jgi:hypothetical protein
MMADFEFVFWYEVLGAHTHVTFFVSRAGHTRGKAGDLVMNNEEFAAFRLVGEKVGMEFYVKERRL